MHNELEPNLIDHSRLANEVLQANPILVKKISEANEVADARVAIVLTEVIRFLNLIAFSEQVLSPSPFVDRAWHEFILCTRSYWRFCQETFGRMIHHSPGGSADTNDRQLDRTLELYRQHFGTPDPRIWDREDRPEDSECGSCESQ